MIQLLQSNIYQVLLFVSAITAFLLIAKQDKYSIYGFWLGLITQPLWFYTSYLGHQWGVVALVPFYSYGYILGIRKFHKV